MKSLGAFSEEAAAKFFAWRTVIVETVAANNMVVTIPLVFVIGNNVTIIIMIVMDAVIVNIGIVVVAGMNGAAIPFLFESKAGVGVGGISPVAVVDHIVVNVASIAWKHLHSIISIASCI